MRRQQSNARAGPPPSKIRSDPCRSGGDGPTPRTPLSARADTRALMATQPDGALRRGPQLAAACRMRSPFKLALFLPLAACVGRVTEPELPQSVGLTFDDPGPDASSPPSDAGRAVMLDAGHDAGSPQPTDAGTPDAGSNPSLCPNGFVFCEGFEGATYDAHTWTEDGCNTPGTVFTTDATHVMRGTWVDGVELTDIHETGWLPVQFQQLDLGLGEPEGDLVPPAGYDAWFDELALDTARIGCAR
jgi:hypothetical protein